MRKGIRQACSSFLFGALTVAAIVSAAPDSAARILAGQDQKAAENRYTMQFDKTPWSKVLEWHADQMGLPLISAFPVPPGAFTYATPEGETYTRHELTMIINESLMKQGYVLVPRKQSTVMLKIAKQ